MADQSLYPYGFEHKDDLECSHSDRRCRVGPARNRAVGADQPLSNQSMTLAKLKPATMNTTKLFALVFLALGIIAFAYQSISYKTSVVDSGPIHVTAEKSHTLPLLPIVGLVALLSSIALFVAGNKKSYEAARITRTDSDKASYFKGPPSDLIRSHDAERSVHATHDDKSAASRCRPEMRPSPASRC
jgi:hypothetical protein